MAGDVPDLALSLQSRSRDGTTHLRPVSWAPERTAVIVCDMWDLHHCKNAVLREAEMAPRCDTFLGALRSRGVLVIHAPSGCMKAYEGTPARERARSAPPAPNLPPGIGEWCRELPSESGAIYPIDQTDGGEDDDPREHVAWANELAARGLDPRQPWTRQTDLLHIDQDRDAISDSGVEIWNLLEARGVRHVLLLGVHVNMCVAGRPFGLRQMAKNGKDVALVRDLTDSMYNPRRWPFVSHVQGTALFIRHAETYICPTLTSDQVLGGAPFAFGPATAGPRRTRILLLGDSTTEAKFPKLLAPEEPQLEDAVRILLAQNPSFPPTDVVNLGLSGEFIRRLLDSGRYDRDVASQPDADVVFIRYGLNDRAKRDRFEEGFDDDYRELLERLRGDHPGAVLVPTAVIPYLDETGSAQVNGIIRNVAGEEELPFFDLYTRYAQELRQQGTNALNYRRFPLSKIPAELQSLALPYLFPGADPQVVVLDNRLDAHFGHLPGWYGDRHPNLAGYQVIANETARFLTTILPR
jgi:lysophospholipase L1-like esterase/nicotinamidase-related amidase